MKLPDNVFCKICKNVFCCPECKRKHEIRNHSALILKTEANLTKIYMLCPICEKKPLLQRENLSDELLTHIEANHLPLNCKKCSKMCTKIEDIREFSKCVRGQGGASVCETIPEILITNAVGKYTTMGTQTSPMPLHDENNSRLTPVSLINQRWKSKYKRYSEEFISDSVSSIKNISSIPNSSLARSIGTATVSKGKLVRSTSTPLQSDMSSGRVKEYVFCSSTGSSCNSGCEKSSITENQLGTPVKKSSNGGPCQRITGRTKLSAATPLRQIMSKSIQRALSEHGFPGTVYNDHKRNRALYTIEANASAKILSSPLDLRLSPAIRRSSVPSITFDREIGKDVDGCSKIDEVPVCRTVLLSSKKTTTESIVITRTHQLASIESSMENSNSSKVQPPKCPSFRNSTNISSNTINSTCASTNSVYQTCRCVEIVTSTEMNSEMNLQKDEEESSKENIDNNLPIIDTHKSHLEVKALDSLSTTPTTRIRGSVIKKNLIAFETPTPLNYSHHNTTSEDQFFTPNTHFTCIEKQGADRLEPEGKTNCTRPSSCSCKNVVGSDPINKSPIKDNRHEMETDDAKGVQVVPFGRFWSVMSSVMRIPSFASGVAEKNNDSKGSTATSTKSSKSLLRRCASIAGSIVRSKRSEKDDKIQTLKRKRTNKCYACSQYICESHEHDPSTIASKRYRIQGRKPLSRMRSNSLT